MIQNCSSEFPVDPVYTSHNPNDPIPCSEIAEIIVEIRYIYQTKFTVLIVYSFGENLVMRKEQQNKEKKSNIVINKNKNLKEVLNHIVSIIKNDESTKLPKKI